MLDSIDKSSILDSIYNLENYIKYNLPTTSEKEELQGIIEDLQKIID